MIFSKTFGYALRGILYIALMRHEGRYVQIEEIAASLAVPRHFLGKILKMLVKEGLLISVKGPNGGFALAPQTLQTSLYKIVELTDGLGAFSHCVLRLRHCNVASPCPLHFQMEGFRNNLKDMLVNTLVANLLGNDKEQFIKSIAANEFETLL